LFHRRSFFNLQDNGGMTFLMQLAQSTLAARLVCIVLLAALAGLVTDAILKVVYGAPAPAINAVTGTEVAQSTPNWLAGGTATIAPASDLKLLGVVAQGVFGMALVQQTGKRAQVLHVGQALADGTQLKSVQGKTATILVNHELRTFTLETNSPSSPALAVNQLASAPPVMPEVSAQVAQQLQQLQQAAAGEAQAPQPSAINETSSVSAFKKRFGARP
jgi:hypothetical protein